MQPLGEGSIYFFVCFLGNILIYGAYYLIIIDVYSRKFQLIFKFYFLLSIFSFQLLFVMKFVFCKIICSLIEESCLLIFEKFLFLVFNGFGLDQLFCNFFNSLVCH